MLLISLSSTDTTCNQTQEHQTVYPREHGAFYSGSMGLPLSGILYDYGLKYLWLCAHVSDFQRDQSRFINLTAGAFKGHFLITKIKPFYFHLLAAIDVLDH